MTHEITRFPPVLQLVLLALLAAYVLLSLLARVDGLLLTGGLDVDPALYGETLHETTEVAAERDRFEVPSQA